jgi:hypothetical protein
VAKKSRKARRKVQPVKQEQQVQPVKQVNSEGTRFQTETDQPLADSGLTCFPLFSPVSPVSPDLPDLPAPQPYSHAPVILAYT